MASEPENFLPGTATADLAQRYQRIRDQSLSLCESLAAEDMTVQSMPDTSPTKWHLAHVTWFFERFILTPGMSGYEVFDESFDYLFNSYYYTAGEMHARPRRGLLSRPTVDQIVAYRAHVDEHMRRLMEAPDDELEFLVTLGLNHEQQHQELLLTDIKHVLAQNPLRPAYRDDLQVGATEDGDSEWNRFNGGVVEIGHAGDGFCYDNETPRHRTLLRDFEIASRPVTNAEYLAFVRDGGYRQCEHWLSDGWAKIRSDGWSCPLYWEAGESDEDVQEFTLGGMRPLDMNAPVSHLSYFEADAYARWAGARLPSEAEWEVAASPLPVDGNFVESASLHPRGNTGKGMTQLYGDVWEWTASPYAPYPGFKPLAGSLGEYNGKFMCSQMVLRGGSCATPGDHVRASYRNFFYPGDRWQFSGLRLARDL
jgi:ergothioneine biosynthesis protein EgtB